MFKQTILSLLTLCFYNSKAVAQPADIYQGAQSWMEKPVLHPMPASFLQASAVYLMDSRTFHYKVEGKNLEQYNYVYRLIKVTDDKGIEMFNKIYIPISRQIEISEIKARVITSTGKVIDVPSEKIKEEEEEGRLYKLFAMEGIDKGAEIEYSYVIKKSPTFFGSEIFQSKKVPYYQARLLVISPDYLQFSAKGSNGFKVVADSVQNGERLLAGYSENIIELDDEKYGLPDPYMQRADYKLSFNLSNNKDVELYTWKEAARKVYTNLTSTTEKEKKAITKFVNAANIPDGTAEVKTIQLLEDYMKTTINADDKLVGEDADDIEKIIKTANANNFGITRFFVAMLENKNIRYQAVFPSIRDQLPLDEELANWNRLDEMLIYFPNTGKFVQPSAAILRYPYTEPYWAGTKGFFLKGTTIGDVKTAVGKFDSIPLEPFEQHAQNMEVYARLDASGDSVIINCKQILKGYAAVSYRPIWAFLPKDKQEETIKDIIQNVAKSEHIENITTENTKLTDATDNKPLVISSTIYSAELLEKAGNKLLFKIGELIGSQVQMYQEKPRQLPAEVEYPHVLYRKIKFDIPDGYSVKNLNDLNIDIQHKNDDVVTMGFVSNYKLTGNTLDVEVMETYRNIKYPLSEFETFKKVINAAADFNKVVLVLEKKK
jgi:hypothetical protein